MNTMNIETYADTLFKNYASYRVNAFPQRKFPPEQFHICIDDLVRQSEGLLTIRTVGQSFELRPIRVITAGSGATSILLWSQMHGDESTATMAIADILSYFTATQGEASTQAMLSSLTIHFLPILNPDGAARFQRRTAQNIDMNRDALAQRTPEARILTQLQKQLKPQFGFNLHDQELSTVGSTKELTAIALLAPAYNVEKSFNDVRTRATKIATVFASVMNRVAPKKIAKYDDGFEPRAFGDNIQKWGTSTVLVESGHALNDPEKDSIRKLNMVGLLSCFAVIAEGALERYNTALYDMLPFNGKRAYDVIIRNVMIDNGNSRTTEADLGISYQADTHSEMPPKLVDLGDLHTFTGVKELDGRKKLIPQSALTLGEPFEWEKYFI